MTRSSPSKALTRVDLPTLGRPTMAILGGKSSSSVASGSGGKSARARLIRSRTPSPWAEEIA
ncbi:conserved hypothetical protein [Ricinus communis]|uniref:Uncharacterized protein n=1 Tax=Ricinus communis TaxID=3988 RepID=B9TC03_RICCO|nr:conserved hypothetical protein [Ricinus communis]